MQDRVAAVHQPAHLIAVTDITVDYLDPGEGLFVELGQPAASTGRGVANERPNLALLRAQLLHDMTADEPSRACDQAAA